MADCVLGYEILNYKITYNIANGGGLLDHYVSTEEEAVKFIRKHRSGWTEYRLVKNEYGGN